MKLNNKGFAISTVMYIILVIALMLIMATLGLLSSRKITLDKIKKSTLTDIKHKTGTDITYQTYRIGDTVKYKNIDFYVIADSSDSKSYVQLIKQDALTYEDISNYNPANIVNTNGYGYLPYTNNSYENSLVKKVLDSWVTDKLDINDLKEINNYSYRLINGNDYSNLSNYDWMYSDNYSYFTMNIEADKIGVLNSDKTVIEASVTDKYAIRPVIILLKKAISEG